MAKSKSERRKHPEWIKVKAPGNRDYLRTQQIVNYYRLNTVCQEACCPNIAECYSQRVTTFLIMGKVCTRNCRFCNVQTGIPGVVDEGEAERISAAVSGLDLKHVVITSVTRDDLPDGGVHYFTDTVYRIKEREPACSVEVLVPDFKGDRAALHQIVDAPIDVFAHNLETVRRLYPTVREQADYELSLNILRIIREMRPALITKSGLMLGLGETMDEVKETIRDLRQVDCNILTFGQYLQPTKVHLPVSRYLLPSEFTVLAQKGEQMGFKHVESGPLVRSSYHAGSVLYGKF